MARWTKRQLKKIGVEVTGKDGNKFSAVGSREDGIYFPSLGERRRYHELKLLQKAGRIYGLTCHPRFPIIFGGTKICDVVFDFSYYEEPIGWTVEDFKGKQTSESRLRQKLFDAFYNRRLKLVTKADLSKKRRALKK